MFKELAPYLRQRAVLLTVTHLEEDQIRVNIVPQKLKDGENAALTTPLSVTGTADELDRELPSTLVDFVSSHLQLKNSLERAKAEMDAAAKTAQAEARAKTKANGKKDEGKPVNLNAPAAGSTKAIAEPAKPEPPKTASLFELSAESPAADVAATATADEEEEILAEASEMEDSVEEEDQLEAA